VLVIDDEEGIRDIMVHMLSAHRTVQAASGEEAKKLLEVDQKFDLILCDVMMPGLSGMDLHQWLATDNPSLAERFIFITGGAFTPRTRKYLNQVDNLRLEKPFNIANFKKIVNDQILLAQAKRDA
jgi:CheY-like chemotaxis protein